MVEAARACSNQRRALIGSWVTLPTTGVFEIVRGGDENIAINHGCGGGDCGGVSNSSATVERWRQLGGGAAVVAASAAVAAAHSATTAARWQQRRGCGGGGSATARRRWQLGGSAAVVAASAVVAAVRQRDVGGSLAVARWRRRRRWRQRDSATVAAAWRRLRPTNGSVGSKNPSSSPRA